MKLNRLIYHKKLSIIGVILFLICGSIKLLWTILKTLSEWLYKSIRWFVRYIQFCKSGYCYSDIKQMVNSMTGREFEVFCFHMFKALNYSVKLTQATADGGKDLILKDNNNNITYVECKRWNSNNGFKVGRPEIQKLIGSAYGDCVKKMLFITTGEYTNEAFEYATKIDNLQLWTIDNLMLKLTKIDQREIPKILFKVFGTKSKIIKLQPCN